MQIKKAVITAAGKNQRTLPLQSLVDRDGCPKTALAIIVEEVFKAGIEEICIVLRPGDREAYRTAAGALAGRLQFVEQAEPLGYGHAVHCAAAFTGEDPFLLLVGDHLYVSSGAKSCAEQLIAVAATESCAVSAVQATHESKLPFYGAVGGRLVAGRQRLYHIDTVLEKPTPTEAEQRLLVPGLRAGRYLCFFGMHVLTATIMERLAEMGAGGWPNVTLSAVLHSAVARQRCLALELEGRRYDIGLKYGLLTAQMALALDGKDRDEVLSNLVEMLAVKGTSNPAS